MPKRAWRTASTTAAGPLTSSWAASRRPNILSSSFAHAILTVITAAERAPIPTPEGMIQITVNEHCQGDPAMPGWQSADLVSIKPGQTLRRSGGTPRGATVAGDSHPRYAMGPGAG